jgi:PAS domain S-box-containing protein
LRPLPFACAAAVVVAVLFVLDRVSGDDTIFVTLYVLGPLLAALFTAPGPTAAVAALAIVLAAIGVLEDGDIMEQDLIRLTTVASGSALAVWIAALRSRLLGAHDELAEALGQLDVVFEHAPIGLALLDRDLRYVRVNDRLAEINGLRARDHLGRTIVEILPDLPAEVAEDVARVAETGSALVEVDVSGATPARPGVARSFVASYWPVLPAGGGPPVGVGLVVIEVTERRQAVRALREQTDRYEALMLALADAGEGLVVLERDGRCVYANHAFEQLCGYAFPELAAMDTLLELVVEYQQPEVRERALDRIEAGMVQPGQALTMVRRDGGWVDLEVGGTPLEVEGRRQLVVVVRDVTARRHAERERERLLARAALLAEASELFDQSLDEELTMRSVARLCVREIAQTCVILLGDGPDRVRRVTAVARDATRERGLQEALLRDPLEERDGDPVVEVMRGAGGLVAPSPAGLGTPRSVIVPLRARGRAHGVLVAGFDDLAAGEDAEALALFHDLGRRAALALDNARLYDERDQIARTLQRSLLPTSLPEIPGVELAARYLAAGDGNEVGGDFYDCFPTGGGDWALVIGDVCGKGAEAATVTALARYTLRAAAQRTRRPRAVLRELNEALLRQRLDYRFCTVLYASLTPRDGRLDAVVATGGHPLPLVLRASGEVETAGAPGSLLGILDVPDLSEQALELGPGDALVLFTDGVTEATTADQVSGPERLAAFLAGHAGEAATEIADAVERNAVESQSGPARDDVAVLVARAAARLPAPAWG